MKLEDITIGAWYVVELDNSRKARQILHKGKGFLLVRGVDPPYIRIVTEDVVSPAEIINEH